MTIEVQIAMEMAHRIVRGRPMPLEILVSLAALRAIAQRHHARVTPDYSIVLHTPGGAVTLVLSELASGDTPIFVERSINAVELPHG